MGMARIWITIVKKPAWKQLLVLLQAGITFPSHSGKEIHDIVEFQSHTNAS